MKAARLAWFERQLDLDPDRLVFLDETATNTKMARRYGRAPRGERCRVAIPFGHWKTITVTAGLRANGLMATALFDGPMTGARFRSYVDETLVPALKRGDTVVLDNLPAHKVGGIRAFVDFMAKTGSLKNPPKDWKEERRLALVLARQLRAYATIVYHHVSSSSSPMGQILQETPTL